MYAAGEACLIGYSKVKFVFLFQVILISIIIS